MYYWFRSYSTDQIRAWQVGLVKPRDVASWQPSDFLAATSLPADIHLRQEAIVCVLLYCSSRFGLLHRLQASYHREHLTFPIFQYIANHSSEKSSTTPFLAPSLCLPACPKQPILPHRHPDQPPDQPLPKMSPTTTANPPATAESKKKEPLGTAPVKEKPAEEYGDDSDSDSDDPEGKGKEAGAKGKEHEAAGHTSAHDASAKPHSSAKKHTKDLSGKPKIDAGECLSDWPQSRTRRC